MGNSNINLIEKLIKINFTAEFNFINDSSIKFGQNKYQKLMLQFLGVRQWIDVTVSPHEQFGSTAARDV